MAKAKMKKEFAMNDEGLGEDVLDILDGFGALPGGQSPQPSPMEAQVDEVVQGLSGAKPAAQVYLIDVRQLEPYPDQPFQLYTQERLQELSEDIRRVGILSPILARRHGKKLQILAGHNRWQAAKLAGLSQAPVLIVEADDDQAILIVTSTNLRQREKLLPSEKAFAYKMQMDALKRQGQRAGENYSAASLITEQTGDSRVQIHRYVRLTYLDSGLLELLNRGRISMTPAVAVSYLTAENQAQVFALIRDFGAKLTIDRANALKNRALEKDGKSIAKQELDKLLLKTETVREQRKGGIALNYNRLREYLPPHANAEEAEMWIIRALRTYQGKDK